MTAFLAILGRVPLKAWVVGGIAAAFVALVIGLKVSIDRAERAEERARTEAVKTEALDRVATETTTTRQDQKEREDEVEQLPGADAPLPPGFGADLERVRNRGRDPRQP